MNYAKEMTKIALNNVKEILIQQGFVKKGNMFFRFKNKCMLQYVAIISY